MEYDIHFFKTIIFDLDGTLINTAPDVRLALNTTLALYGKNPINSEEIYDLMGWGARIMIEKAFSKVGDYPTSFNIETVLAQYIEFYKAKPVVDTYIYPGVVEVLENLKNNQIKLAICTNKPSIMTHVVLEKLNLKHFFDVIIAGDEITTPKPNGAHINEILKQIKASHFNAIMIGDSDVDKIAAENANLPFLGVRYGYAGNKLKADFLINHFHELPQALRHIAAMREAIS